MRVLHLLSAGGLALGFEEARRSLKGQKIMAVEATEYWSGLSVDGERIGGVKGFFE